MLIILMLFFSLDLCYLGFVYPGRLDVINVHGESVILR